MTVYIVNKKFFGPFLSATLTLIYYKKRAVFFSFLYKMTEVELGEIRPAFREEPDNQKRFAPFILNSKDVTIMLRGKALTHVDLYYGKDSFLLQLTEESQKIFSSLENALKVVGEQVCKEWTFNSTLKEDGVIRVKTPKNKNGHYTFLCDGDLDNLMMNADVVLAAVPGAYFMEGKYGVYLTLRTLSI